MSPDERKKCLGFGGLARVAKRTKRTRGHVSQVNSEQRRDERVERAIAREVLRRRPEVDPATIWPVDYPVYVDAEQQSAAAAPAA